MNSPPFDIDTSRWPIVVMRLRGVLSTADYERMLDESERIQARQDSYVGIVDLRELVTAANAPQRQLIANRAREMEKKYGDVALGQIMIVNSALVRGALTAVEWLRQRKKRDLWVASMDEAFHHAERLCRSHGVALNKVS